RRSAIRDPALFRRGGMRLEENVEERLPGPAVVLGSLCRLPDSALGPAPGAADEGSGPVAAAVRAGQDHPAVLEPPLEQKELAAVRDPALVPDAAGSVVDAEASAAQSVELVVSLQDRAAVEDDLHPGPPDELASFIEAVGVPVAGPEVELAMRFGSAPWRSRRGGAGRGEHRGEDGQQRGRAATGRQAPRHRGAFRASSKRSLAAPGTGSRNRASRESRRRLTSSPPPKPVREPSAPTTR